MTTETTNKVAISGMKFGEYAKGDGTAFEVGDAPEEGKYIFELVRISDASWEKANPKFPNSNDRLMAWFNFKIVALLEMESEESNIGLEASTKVNLSAMGEKSGLYSLTKALVGKSPKELKDADMEINSLISYLCQGTVKVTVNEKGEARGWFNNPQPLTTKQASKFQEFNGGYIYREGQKPEQPVTAQKPAAKKPF